MCERASTCRCRTMFRLHHRPDLFLVPARLIQFGFTFAVFVLQRQLLVHYVPCCRFPLHACALTCVKHLLPNDSARLQIKSCNAKTSLDVCNRAVSKLCRGNQLRRKPAQQASQILVKAGFSRFHKSHPYKLRQ